MPGQNACARKQFRKTGPRLLSLPSITRRLLSDPDYNLTMQSIL